MKENPLLVNRIKTPDGTILQSKHRHDYQSYKDKNGETYILDGGIDYIKSSINKEKATSLHLYLNDDFNEIRKYFYNDYFFKEKSLSELPDTYLEQLQKNIKKDQILVILLEKELIYRFNNNIKI